VNDFIALFVVFVPFLGGACLLYYGGQKLIKRSRMLKDYRIEDDEERILDLHLRNCSKVYRYDKKVEKFERKLLHWEMRRLTAPDRILHFFADSMCAILETKLKEARENRAIHFIIERSLQVRLMEGYTHLLKQVHIHPNSRGIRKL